MSQQRTHISSAQPDGGGVARGRRPALLGMLAVGGLVAGSATMAAPALATPADDDGAGPDQDGLAPTMLILDASGSMAAEDGDASGTTRMQAARQAVTELVNASPDQAPLGLTVYGANVSSAPEDQEEGCRDIEVLASPETGQGDQIVSTVGDIEASGYTPIGESLRVADGELPDSGERSIILVSDGIDTCAPPPPCEVAAELNDAGVDLTLHAIGFKVDDEARADLECIAQEGGGTYADAEDAEELAAEMERAAMRGMRGYETAGAEVEGGSSPMQATEIGPGEYQDELEAGGSGLTGSGGSEKYYRVPMEPGERLHVTATMIGPEGTRSVLAGGIDNIRLNMGMITNQEEPCVAIGDNSGTSLNFNDGLIAWGISEPLGSAECEGEEMIVGIERAGTLMAEEPFEVELLVRTEPADLDASQMPDAATDVDEADVISQIETDGSDSELFGTSFHDATPIEPGTYTARLVTGERNFLRVPVEYGQSLRFAAELTDGPEPDMVTGLDDIGRFGATLVNPLRQPVPLWDGGELTAGVQTSASVGNGIAANLATDVNFTNRDHQEADPEELRQVYLAGEQYLVIGFDQPLADQDADAEQLEWTYTLVVQVEGESVDGPQVQGWDNPADDGEQAGPGGDLAENADADKQDESDLTGHDEEPGAAADEGPPAATDGGGAVWPYVLGGGILLVLAAGGGWLAVRQLRT